MYIIFMNVFLIDGQIDKFVESRTYHLKPFDLIIPPNKLHKSILCKDYRHERVVIYFDERSVRDKEMLRRLCQYSGVITLPNEAASAFLSSSTFLLQEKEGERVARYVCIGRFDGNACCDSAQRVRQ